MAAYCPNCGQRTHRRYVGGTDRDACPDCDYIEFAKTSIGVGALILQGDRVLLVERGIPPVGRWTFPGGYIEQQDNLQTALVREVREEAGIDVQPQGILFIRNIPTERKNDLYIIFLCERVGEQEPQPDGEESTQARFVAPEEFDQMDIGPFTRWVYETYCTHRPSPLRLIDMQHVQPNWFVFSSTGSERTYQRD